MERMSRTVKAKALKLLKENKIEKELETKKHIHFKVQGKSDVYSVIFDKEKNKWECECRYWSLTQKDCSHIIACKLLM